MLLLEETKFYQIVWTIMFLSVRLKEFSEITWNSWRCCPGTLESVFFLMEGTLESVKPKVRTLLRSIIAIAHVCVWAGLYIMPKHRFSYQVFWPGPNTKNKLRWTRLSWADLHFSPVRNAPRPHGGTTHYKFRLVGTWGTDYFKICC